ncbi:MAG: type II secretion system protein GspM [Pseudomonadota bacterium]
MMRLGLRCSLIYAVALLLLGGLAAAVGVPWQMQNDRYDTEIERRIRQLAHLRGTSLGLPAIEDALNRARQDMSGSLYYFQAANPTLAGADLQGRIQQAVTSHGGEILSTQVLGIEEEKGLWKIPVRFRANLTVEGLTGALYQIEGGKPLIIVRQITLNGMRGMIQQRPGGTKGSPSEMRLDINAEFVGFMRKG